MLDEAGRASDGAASARERPAGAPGPAGEHLARAPTLRYPRRVELSFHHAAIQCADLAACERFYREVFGLAVLRRWPREDGSDRSVWLALGDGFLALERAVEPAPALPWRDGRAGLHLLALRIRPAERSWWEERFRGLGIPIAHRTRWTLYVRDPEGNRVGLSHHPDDEVPA